MNELIKVIRACQQEARAFQSDFARKHASAFAECASRGFITCLQYGVNKGKWMATAEGIEIAQKEV